MAYEILNIEYINYIGIYFNLTINNYIIYNT